MSMNVGHFHKDEYVKFVNFTKAVLWKTKELSLQTYVINKILADKIPLIVFIDMRKGEAWKFATELVMKHGQIKTVGPGEEQYYFPIQLSTISKLPSEPVKEVVA